MTNTNPRKRKETPSNENGDQLPGFEIIGKSYDGKITEEQKNYIGSWLQKHKYESPTKDLLDSWNKQFSVDNSVLVQYLETYKKKIQSENESKENEKKKEDANVKVTEKENESEKGKEKEKEKETKEKQTSNSKSSSLSNSSSNSSSSSGSNSNSNSNSDEENETKKNQKKEAKQQRKQLKIEKKKMKEEQEKEEIKSMLNNGLYVPPWKLKKIQQEINDHQTKEYQRMMWDALNKSINGLINKLNVSNIKYIIVEIFSENLIRGSGIFIRSSK
ncbi:pre-mRNA-splicing factor cwc22 [Anaeramoeba flamelloides]|uniref:Pre-mRNA-splicing factor cwc22 n=1 Tax=Anaeramoeba flamelloides TaxID=1746091 RepID=A0ABQ8Y5Y2_9EUKA|nr:pre-mRNA-splicing factor cwc22 [Anaeramoeba flamelloides]